MAVANDTVAGLCGSVTRLAQRGDLVEQAAFIICGSGLGGAVLRNGQSCHVEIAHVPLMDALNPLGQERQCNVPGHDFVCVERVTAARAGIEDLYLQQTGEPASGFDLAARYLQGEPLPTLLYETSARTLAHAIAGLAGRFAFDTTSAVICHGGNFEIEPYRLAVQQSLDRLPGIHPRLIFSRDLAANVCLDGASVLALTRHQ